MFIHPCLSLFCQPPLLCLRITFLETLEPQPAACSVHRPSQPESHTSSLRIPCCLPSPLRHPEYLLSSGSRKSSSLTIPPLQYLYFASLTTHQLTSVSLSLSPSQATIPFLNKPLNHICSVLCLHLSLCSRSITVSLGNTRAEGAATL